MTDKKLFLLDAYALIYRAYYALIRAPRVTSKGFNTSAIYGFVNTLEELLRRENPSHIAVCFDPHGPTFRHEAYADYKAQREKQPEDITRSVPYIKRILDAYGIPVVEIAGFEADDVIGTLAHRAEAEGFTTYMMTPDKDYGQLVTERIFIYKPGLRGADIEVRGPKEVCERYGIASPLQVIDLLALEGDAVDNIPGCPGVGGKTAVKLIGEWGSIENLLNHVAEVRGAVGRKVADNAEAIRFSKFLATIRTDVPLSIAPDELCPGVIDIARLRDIYNELEFRTLISRLPKEIVATVPTPEARTPDLMGSLFDLPAEGTDEPTAESNCPAASALTVVQLTDPVEVRRIAAEAAAGEWVGVASYATGTDSDFTATWRAVAWSTAPNHAWFVALPPMGPERSEMIGAVAELFCGSATVVSHDVKRDMMLLRREGHTLSAPYFDTSVAHYLLEPEMSHSLPRIAAAFLNYHTIDYIDASERTVKKGEPLPTGDECRRLGEIADITLRLRAPLADEIDRCGMTALLADIELPLIKVLADMECIGVRIDPTALTELSRQFSASLRAMEAQAYELAGGPFNVASPAQVGEVLFERLKLDPKAKRTKRGAYSTTEEVLEKYRDAHPIIDVILEIRGLRKLLTTYVDALPQLINPQTGKIHTTYNQTVTATGRISSTNPNLQNIPVRTDQGREIRRAFIPEPGHLLMSADYSQIELRVIAHMSADPDMIEAFKSDTDIHQSTAAKIYHKPIGEVTPEERRRAKTANFGIIYGISAFGLAQRLRIPRVEAKELIDGYFASYPHIRQYIDTVVERAKADGRVTTIMNRRRRLPDINSANAVVRGFAERNAVNAPIQGSAADIIKAAMVRVSRDFDREGLRSRMIMQVHDELVIDVDPAELDRVKAIVMSAMMGAFSAAVPLEVSIGVGENWLEAH